ncbi:MAG: TraB family protein [Candidatus Hadarchaeum sp.]|uniref:TraB family protein n=1 Tax=Candidatus Hadarchaeum sp. TaxID=2883567 RepID=UPI00316C78B7
MIKKIGDRLTIVGVAHVLPKSVEEAKGVIASERPDLVAVELDPARYLALTRGTRAGILDFWRAGPEAWLLTALILLLQGKFSRQTGVAAGEEMLAAVQKAREIGAQVHLIDRDIGITLNRLVSGMPAREKLRLFGNLIVSLLPLGKGFELSRITEEQVVENLLQEFRKLSPRAYDILISERDRYMAMRLAEFLLSGKRVVCVVGAGHVLGVWKELNQLLAGKWSLNLEYSAG